MIEMAPCSSSEPAERTITQQATEITSATAHLRITGLRWHRGQFAFMGGASTPGRAGPVLHLVLRYMQALIAQMSQAAMYYHHHSLDQQLCRLATTEPRASAVQSAVDHTGAHRQYARRGS